MKFTPQHYFVDYYDDWIKVYKEGAIRDVTLQKYFMTAKRLRTIIPDLKMKDLTRTEYQRFINVYAKDHERQTVRDFHTQIKTAILDAVDEGLIPHDPTRRIMIKGKPPAEKKAKFMSQFDLQKLLKDLKLGPKVTWDWLILLIAKTGMRFSEAIAITPKDFDFAHQLLNINKTWDYKHGGGFTLTKNKSSVRKIQIDWQLVMQFSYLTQNLPQDKPIFVKPGKKIYNSTLNDALERHCKKLKIEPISVHGLRHTHASILLRGGVSVASISRRLGHSNIATTQKVYLHVIKELETQDVDAIMRSLAALT